ncbi:class I SAM-dependent methyltransferase [Candidatus Nitrosocosmicus agrestis]|uniref:class I SAM-dependent methyltransferase n=1 Tax=Candidatus Nitrosocosmicus agrestis TaxID=2563600 RepID=UPI0019176609|nr:class I SAM-dependent methyltransferase [Candidatus Nitrosocosmicus sp. SS]MDR4492765.1 class I SAM-dependent methyltransferase [Candidatus Nitrosocosmicus sp.]
MKSTGLGTAYWNEVINVLRNIIPVYDRVNSAISIGRDNEFRIEGIKKSVFPGNTILDAGSGYGNMSKIVIEMVSKDVYIHFYDPIPEMLKGLSENFKGYDITYSKCSGVFEKIPFRSNTFDAVICGYSIRDSINFQDAFEEIHRILKDGGRFLIVDLGKPDNWFLRNLVSIYLRYLLVVIAFITAGKRGLPFGTLYGTFLRWPKNNDLKLLLSKYFSKVEMDKKLFGGAVIVVAHK